MNGTLDLNDIISLLMKRWKIVLIIVSIFTAIGGYVSYKTPSVYQANMDLLINYVGVNEEDTTVQSSDVEMSLRLVETYKEIMTSDRVINNVMNRLDNNLSKAELEKSITIKSTGNSQIITVVTTGKTAKDAADLVENYAITFQEEVKELMNLENINILNTISPEKDVEEVQPSIIIFTVVAGISGFILASVIILFQEIYSTKINTSLKVEKVLGIPSIGTISKIKKKKWDSKDNEAAKKKIISNTQISLVFTEEIRKIRANIEYLIREKGIKTLLFTSTDSGDGKSLVSVNLAISLAMNGKKTIYIDADLRSPVGRKLFDLPNRNGLTSVISGYFPLKDVIQSTAIENVSFIGSGPIPPNPTEVLSSKKVSEIINDLKFEYDVIIIDTSALVVADAISLATVVDGCLYVIDARQTKEKLACESLIQLQKVQAPILGAILNKSQTSIKEVAYHFE